MQNRGKIYTGTKVLILYFPFMIKAYLANLKKIALNIILLYRNFPHWSLSKVIVFLYANIFALILSIPFVAIIVYQYFHTYSTLVFTGDYTTLLNDNFGSILITIGLLLIIATFFICTYTYGYFLMQNVYKHYLS